MTDIQSASSVSFWLLYLLEYKLSQAPKMEFSCLKKLYPRDISCELVKGVFPGSFLLC